MKISIPEFALVALVGPSGSGKSTFARKHFKETEILSSDTCRGWVSDDESDQSATHDAFDVLEFIAKKRLKNRRLVVIDATNVQVESRRSLVKLAREHDALCVAIVLDLPVRVCHQRNQSRENRRFGVRVIKNQHSQMRRSMRGLKREGFRHIFTLNSEETIEAAQVERVRLWTDRRDENGPFDIIGDVHGCYDELASLLDTLGYSIENTPTPSVPKVRVVPPEGRRAIFLGDLVDRGPKSPEVLALVMSMVQDGTALCVQGNHDNKFLRYLNGRNVQLRHGLAETVDQMESWDEAFRGNVRAFLADLRSHFLLDNGRLVVAHAGLKEEYQGRASGRVRSFALYGDTTGEVDSFGRPVRLLWAESYRGSATVIYGHTPVRRCEWLNRTMNIDTGCVFGGRLTALRYPEKELVDVEACSVYFEPVGLFEDGTSQDGVEGGLSAQQEYDDLLYFEDVSGKRRVQTRIHRDITIREENAAAALEVMSRFAVHPKWLIYLPPTMSPSETSEKPGMLEHPEEAFSYFEKQGIEEVVCEEKHMGSRAVLIVGRDEGVARKRFGVEEERLGVCYSRIGRTFFNDANLERQLLERVRDAATKSGLWEELKTDWLCLDAELMPWTLKAQELVRQQYAAVGSSAIGSMDDATRAIQQAVDRGVDMGDLKERFDLKRDLVTRYREAYRGYCWPVNSIEDIRLAPFHLLASEGALHVDRDHLWHMETIARLAREDETLIIATPYRVVATGEGAAREGACSWWSELTAAGGEGMVVKPRAFVARGRRGLIQPALKCRGPEYLRIIYGPEYTMQENLQRLRQRGLRRKRSSALREFALGVEGLERFVNLEPLRRVHECVFGVLALESEPIDPRL